MEFQYQYLLVLLYKSPSRLTTLCIDSSKQMLHLLPEMVSESEEPYNGIVWQLLCCPFTPFLVLFGEILSSGKRVPEENKEALDAMERLPVYLKNMSLRNSLAVKLERIAIVLVQHARLVIQSQGTCPGEGLWSRPTSTECLTLRISHYRSNAQHKIFERHIT